MSVTDTWRPKRPGPASDRDNVTRQTLRADIRAPSPEKPYVNIIGGRTLGTACSRGTPRFSKKKPQSYVWYGIPNVAAGCVDGSTPMVWYVACQWLVFLFLFCFGLLVTELN